MNALKAKKNIVWNFADTAPLLSFEEVHTVCQQSKCPNRSECSSQKSATFLIAGDLCTRNCAFCHVHAGKPLSIEALKEKETSAILSAVSKLNMKYVVLTSVTRDDSEKELANYFAFLVKKLNQAGCLVEVLIPDFHAKEEFLKIITEASPAVIAHNIETVSRLSKKMRPQADYQTSLLTLKKIKEISGHIITKSSFMTGLGENNEDINQLLIDLKEANVDILMIGQYLRPSEKQAIVKKNYTEQEFNILREKANKMGFLHTEAGTFVRSSYKAREVFLKLTKKQR
ncbi:MAG: lipoyl synthase [Spirochaetia bacterium]|nr:lipoyl synthase [Spirochaetia bacterium]